MLEDLATNLSTMLAIASLLFFVAVYIVVTIGVFRTGAADHDSRARIPLDDGTDAPVRSERPARG